MNHHIKKIKNYIFYYDLFYYKIKLKHNFSLLLNNFIEVF
jgi:hypothetical protein